MEHGYDSERGRAAIARMNEIHGRFQIRNEDFLYVLSTFVFEPIRWNERFGWRRMTEKERVALFHFWREVGGRMNIQDIPGHASTTSRDSTTTTSAKLPLHGGEQRVGAATRDSSRAGSPLDAALRGARHPRLHGRTAHRSLRFPEALPRHAPLRGIVPEAPRRVLRLLPRRSRPLLRTEMKQRSYPCGYAVEQLGPPTRCRPPL